MLSKLFIEVDGLYCETPSITEPNQVMSISEIMARFGMGMNSSILEGGNYDNDQTDNFEDDPTRDVAFDFQDAHELERVLRERKEMTSEDITESEGDETTDDSKAREETKPSEPQPSSKSKEEG